MRAVVLRLGLQLGLVLGLLLALPAHADKVKKKAARHFAAAEKAEKRKDYATAIREYKKAYKLQPEPAVLYNIAVDYELLSDWGQAAEHYRRYVEETVDPEDRAQVEATIDALQERLGRTILAEAVEAKGGEDRLRSIHDVSNRFSIITDDLGTKYASDYDYVITADSRWSKTHSPFQKATRILVITPQAGWEKTTDGKVRELPAEELASFQERMWRDPEWILTNALAPGTLVRALGTERINGRDYDALELARADGNARTKVLLDPRHHLVFRIEYERDAAIDRTDYTSYRDVNGVKVAHHQATRYGSKKVSVEVKEVLIDNGVSADLFTEPAAEVQKP